MGEEDFVGTTLPCTHLSISLFVCLVYSVQRAVCRMQCVGGNFQCPKCSAVFSAVLGAVCSAVIHTVLQTLLPLLGISPCIANMSVSSLFQT